MIVDAHNNLAQRLMLCAVFSGLLCFASLMSPPAKIALALCALGFLWLKSRVENPSRGQGGQRKTTLIVATIMAIVIGLTAAYALISLVHPMAPIGDLEHITGIGGIFATTLFLLYTLNKAMTQIAHPTRARSQGPRASRNIIGAQVPSKTARQIKLDARFGANNLSGYA